MQWEENRRNKRLTEVSLPRGTTADMIEKVCLMYVDATKDEFLY
jgi:hypothetical protein